jgi:hypothetical protein
MPTPGVPTGEMGGNIAVPYAPDDGGDDDDDRGGSSIDDDENTLQAKIHLNCLRPDRADGESRIASAESQKRSRNLATCLGTGATRKTRGKKGKTPSATMRRRSPLVSKHKRGKSSPPGNDVSLDVSTCRCFFSSSLACPKRWPSAGISACVR